MVEYKKLHKKQPGYYQMEIRAAIGFKRLSITEIHRKLNGPTLATVRKYLDIMIADERVESVMVKGHWFYKNGRF